MKMKYKKYPLTYEKVFTSEGCLKTFTFEGLVTDYPGGTEAYKNKFKSFFVEFDRFFWKLTIEYYWLQRRFVYQGIRKEHTRRTFIRTDSAYSTFIKHILGTNYQIFTTTFLFSKSLTYFQDFYGNMDTVNPFENPEYYTYPYKNISLAHLTLVYQMDERLDLLKEAEDQKMSFYEFLDFVINYINCVNDEQGRTVFTLYRAKKLSNWYIQYHFRKGTIGYGKNAVSQKEIRRKPYEYKKI